ncbi:MAG: MarR family transcriptional regulator [Burkholderiales bacterium]|nr:MAG: MarR family transcriptional regulator [Burkholderiales bacterium]
MPAVPPAPRPDAHADRDATDSVGFLVADVARLMRRAFQARLEGSALTYAQARALVWLAREQGLRQIDLAEQLEIQPITLARLVDQLAEAGLVERRADPTDRRAYRLFLTRAAAPRVAEIRAIGDAIREEALAGLGAKDAAQTVAGLRRMRASLSAPGRAGARPPVREA